MTYDCTKWFISTWNKEQRNDPLPRLGALQLLQRKRGECEDWTGLGVFEARALGIPATEEIIQYWATSFSSHFFDVAINAQKNIPYEQLTYIPTDTFLLQREPGKVLRLTYSKQPNVLATLVPSTDIPHCILRTLNYKDVTGNYWESENVGSHLFESTQPISNLDKKKVVYSCIFNMMDWRPIWWSLVKNDSATFTQMTKGVVYLPMYFQNEKLVPAGYPVAVGYHHTLVLQPDTLHTHTIHINEQERYLKFRSGKTYKLYYWTNRWKQVGSQVTADSTTELVFNNVPKNALLLMIPDYSQRKERPFMITEEGERVWW